MGSKAFTQSQGLWVRNGLPQLLLTNKEFLVAAWTLPHRITDWCEILTTALDRRSRRYFMPVVPRMVLATGRRTLSNWMRATGVTND